MSAVVAIRTIKTRNLSIITHKTLH